MKHLLIVFLSLFVIISCKNEQVDTSTFVTISGKINNKKSDVLSIANRKYQKEITLNDKGEFSDTLKIDEGIYIIQNGDTQPLVYLKNGYNIKVEYDVENLTKTLSFSGLGANTSNYFADKQRLQESDGFLDFNAYFILEKPDFDAKVTTAKLALDKLISNAQGLDSVLIMNEKRSNQQLIGYLTRTYFEKHEVLTKLARGATSPTFNYPDINEKKVSLNSLRGKYVYIDVWATWCGPCKVQIPYLKELEDTYKDKNIAFVGLSIDTQENKGQWQQMVEERGLKGYQVLADNDWKSTFIQDYYIKGIPRFILIDPQGKIISPDAPRPSEPALVALFNELNI